MIRSQTSTTAIRCAPKDAKNDASTFEAALPALQANGEFVISDYRIRSRTDGSIISARQLLQVHAELCTRFFGPPHPELVRAILVERFGTTLSVESIGDNLKFLNLPYVEEALFRQRLVRWAITSERRENGVVHFSKLKSRIEGLGLTITNLDLTKALYAARKKLPEAERQVLNLNREVRADAALSSRQRIIISTYRALRASLKKAPTYEELEGELRKLPTNFPSLPINIHARRDAVMKGIKRINAWHPAGEHIILSPSRKTEQRDATVLAAAKAHIKANQGVLNLSSLKEILATHYRVSLRLGQIQGSLERTWDVAVAGKLPMAYQRVRVTNAEIVAAYRAVKARLEGLKVDRHPSRKELLLELNKESAIISATTLRSRLIAINAWRVKEKLPKLGCAAHSDIRPYAILAAHQSLVAHSPATLPTRMQVAAAATVLLDRPITRAQVEVLCSPVRTKRGGVDSGLWTSLSKLKFQRPLPSGILDFAISDFYRDYEGRAKVAPLISEARAHLLQNGGVIGREQLRDRCHQLELTVLQRRTQQVQRVTRNAIENCRQMLQRAPTVDEILSAHHQSGSLFELTRADILAAGRALRAASSNHKDLYRIDARNIKKMFTHCIADEQTVKRFSVDVLAQKLRVTSAAVQVLIQEENEFRRTSKRAPLIVDGTLQGDAIVLLQKYRTTLCRAQSSDDRTVSQKVIERELRGEEKRLCELNRQLARAGLGDLLLPGEIARSTCAYALLHIDKALSYFCLSTATLMMVHEQDKQALDGVERSLSKRCSCGSILDHALRGYPTLLVQARLQGRLNPATFQNYWRTLTTEIGNSKIIEEAKAFFKEVIKNALFESNQIS